MQSLAVRLALACLAALTPLGAAAEDHPFGAHRRILLNPSDDLYPRYVADPRRSRHILSIIHATDSELPDSGDTRFVVSIGGDYPLFRIYAPDAPERAWQVDVEGRFFTQFDIDHNLDEIGHDGRLGLIVSKGVRENLAIRIAGHHTSSHIGDEYILRNDITERLSVRKEELSAGASWTMRPAWRTYGEIGYGVNLGPRNEPLRLQVGVEYESRPILFDGRWYAATDITSFEENEWELSTNLQTGIVFPVAGRSRWYRVGVELYDGRSQLDSFFQYRERYFVIGAWLDL